MSRAREATVLLTKCWWLPTVMSIMPKARGRGAPFHPFLTTTMMVYHGNGQKLWMQSAPAWPGASGSLSFSDALLCSPKVARSAKLPFSSSLGTMEECMKVPEALCLVRFSKWLHSPRGSPHRGFEHSHLAFRLMPYFLV